MRSIFRNSPALLGAAVVGATALGVDLRPVLQGTAFLLGAACALAVMVGWRSAAERLLPPLGVCALSAFALGPLAQVVRHGVGLALQPQVLVALAACGVSLGLALVVRQVAVALPSERPRAPRLTERRRAAVAEILEPPQAAPRRSNVDAFEVFDRQDDR